MRVAVYNQMFALNGKSLVKSFTGHWAIHFQNKEHRVIKRTNINRTVDIIRKSNADIIGISEILSGQEKELTEKLENIGYDYVFFGNGNRTKFVKKHVKVGIASKVKCLKKELVNFPVGDEFSGGSGFIYCYFPELKLNLINVHLAHFRKSINKKQLELLKWYAGEINGKFILMGDFNAENDKLKNYFIGCELTSDKIKTCSLTPVLKLFFHKDLDHVFTRGYRKEGIGTLNGYSDHKLIYVDLEEF